MQTQNHFNLPVHQSDDGEIDLKRILFIFFRNWQWFVVCMALALAFAFGYNNYYRKQLYLIDNSIIVPENSKSVLFENLIEKSLTGMGTRMSLGNEMELLRSYTLSQRVFEKLNWRTTWYRKTYLSWTDLYNREPFIVQEEENAVNIEGIDLFVYPVSDDTYTISARGTALLDREPIEVDFSETVKFGQPFKNAFFHFILHRKDSNVSVVGESYRFRFNSVSALTKAYLKKLKIEQTNKNNEVIRLSLEGAEPLREIHYLNELVDEYINLKLEFQTETQKRSLAFIDKQLSGISDSLNAAGTSVTEFRAQNQVLDISAEGQLVMSQLGEIEKEKSQSQMQLDYFRNLLAYLGKADAIKQVVMPSVVGIQDPSLNAVVMKLTELYSRREVLAFSARENNPSYILLNKEIEQVTSQLRENLVNLIDNAQLSIQSLTRRQNTISRQLNNLPGKEQRLIDIRREYELTNEIYTFLLQRRAEIDIALAATVSDIQIIDPARLERIVRTGVSNQSIYLFALLGGFLIPAIIILLLNVINNTIHLQEDVEKLTPLTIIGNVLHSTHKTELVVAENPRAPVTESYRTIRTNLQYMLSQENRQLIGIHSIRPGEGKTFSAINLACILALNDKKVLLVGADMRKPRLHKILDVSNETGLSTYLIGHTTYEDAVIKTSIDNLWMVASGPVPPNPAELLERDLFKTFIDRARADFDFVVIDNAPVSMVTDGLITSRQADLNIFILRYGVSRKDQLKFINDMAAQGVMKHPALVINDIRLDSFGYGRSYSYRYSYSEGYYEEQEKTGRKWRRKSR